VIGAGRSLPAGFYERFSHEYTDVGGVRLHHVDGGPAGGAPVVPGGGHWTPEENPEFLLDQLLGFLP
jgi:hypothetical protein